jgi:protein-L-isoaspartate(D-aspartate) O-methyltransferase
MTDFSTRRTIMVDTQVRPSDVTKYPLIAAMLAVPREDFVPAAKREAAYVGDHIDLGNGRVMLDPRTFAKMLEVLDVQPDELVLHLGAGLGYGAAVMARMTQAVVALEEIGALADEAETTLGQLGVDNVAVVTGPLVAGDARNAPFDAILIEGGVQHLPDAILTQVKEGGRIVCIFIEGRMGTAQVGYKIDGNMSWRSAFDATAPILPGFARHRAFTL